MSRFKHTRAHTLALTHGLYAEDMTVSSMPDVSPTKWHLAHTTWFWETFVLTPHVAEYQVFNPRYSFLFNSYYVQAGERHCRAQRGLITRPTVNEVLEYRHHVDAAMERYSGLLLEVAAHEIELGLSHEEQHQELMMTDIQHVFWTNPMKPAYSVFKSYPFKASEAPTWTLVAAGPHGVGALDNSGFHFDNEGPRHTVMMEECEVANRLVTNSEYLDFVADGGYRTPALWLAAGWALVQAEKRKMPLYWSWGGGGDFDVMEFGLHGEHSLDLNAPVKCISFFEADAYARWIGMRLPTEFEWEVAAWQPQMMQLYGEAWQWTASPYLPYPRYAPRAGAIGEYNGKWMADQWVLRGGSAMTPHWHSRRTYRNFFPSDTRWQYTGLRLARWT